MNIEKFNEIKMTLDGYKYNSMMYLEYDQLEVFEVLKKDEKLILLSKPHVLGVTEYHYACQSFNDLLAHLDEKSYLSMVPKSWVGFFEKKNFSVYACYNDYFSQEMIFQETYTLICSDDIERVSEITKACYGQSRGFHGEDAQWLKRWLENNNILVHKENDEITGVCLVALYDYEHGPTLWIREIAVHPDHQRKGIGRKLMAGAMTYGKDRGARKAFLAADELNVHAIKLYESFGFKAGNDEQIDMVRYSWA